MAQQSNNLDDMDRIISQIDTTTYYYLGPNGEFDEVDEVISQIDLASEMPNDNDSVTGTEYSIGENHSHLEEVFQESNEMDDVMSQIDMEELVAENETNDADENTADGSHNNTAINGIPVGMLKQYQAAMDKLLPNKSANRYVQAYDIFRKWQESNGIDSFKEEVMMCYFSAAAEKYKPSTVWSMYSMLKKTLIAKHNMDISKYCQLAAFLKTNAAGYESEQSKVFEPKEIQKFMLEAPNIKYLAMKAIVAFGVIGACRGDELTNLTTDFVTDVGKELIVSIPYTNTKTKKPKLFQIDGYFAEIVREYFRLRPANVSTNRVFVQYRDGKCTCQVMGKNSIAKIPKEMAKYLGLPNYDRYTGHAFRRTSTTILANTGVGIETLKRHGPWESTKVCEKYIQNSLAQKRKVGSMISNAINLPSTNKVGDAEEVESKRRAPFMSTNVNEKIAKQGRDTSTSISIASSSQISISNGEPHDVAGCSRDFLGGPSTDVFVGASTDFLAVSTSNAFGGSSSDAKLLSETMKKVNLPSNKENIIFHFSGTITNFNVNTKQ